MRKSLFHNLLPFSPYLIFLAVFAFFFALPLFNPPVFGQTCPGGASPGQQCDSVCTAPGEETVYNWNYACVCAFSTIRSNSACNSGGGGGGGTSGGVGTIRPPAGFGIPTTNDPQTFVAGLVRNGILLMIIIAFVVDLIWTILAGYRFILAQGDPKTISAAWSQIYYGLIGLAVIMASFAIIRMAETFFKVDIISSGLRLPTGFTP